MANLVLTVAQISFNLQCLVLLAFELYKNVMLYTFPVTWFFYAVLFQIHVEGSTIVCSFSLLHSKYSIVCF